MAYTYSSSGNFGLAKPHCQPMNLGFALGRPEEPSSYPFGLAPRTPASRVVFIPGIMGSQLVDRSDNQVLWGDASMLNWLPRIPEWLSRMQQGNGIDQPGSVAPVSLTRIDVPGQRFDINPYSSIVVSLRQQLGNANVLIFPYDWRLSNEFSALRLKRFLEAQWQDAANDPSRRGTIIAHSMGGLVARWYIEQLGGHRFVKRLVTVGTPHHGAPEALKMLLMLGDLSTLTLLLSFIAPILLATPALVILRPLLGALQRMLANFASIYQLMPDFPFVFPSLTATAMEPIATTFQKLAASPDFNQALGRPSAGQSLIRGPRAGQIRNLNNTLRRNVSTLPAFLMQRNVNYIALAGFAHDTVVALRHTTLSNFISLLSRCGDETVPLRSAALPSNHLVRSLFTGSNRKHSDLFDDPAIRRVCLNAVLGLSDLTQGAISAFVAARPTCPPARIFSSALPSPQQVLQTAQRVVTDTTRAAESAIRAGQRAGRRAVQTVEQLIR